MSSSFMSNSEYNSSSSLSLGEILPKYRIPLSDSLYKSENYSSAKSPVSRDIHSDGVAASCSKTGDAILPSVSQLHRNSKNECLDLNCSPIAATLQTVQEDLEDVHSMFD